MSNKDNISNLTETQKKEKKNIIIPLILIIFIIILFALGSIFMYLSTSKEKIITTAINNLYKDYKTKFNNNKLINIEDKSFIVNGNLYIETNIPGLNELKEDQIKYKIGIDSQNKKRLIDFSLEENNNKIINLIYYFINNESYLKFDEYDKLIKTDNNNLFNDENYSNINTENLNYILEEFKNILINSLDMKALKKETATIDINDKEEKVNKLTFSLTKENIKNLNNNFKKNLLKNEKLLTKISETFNIDIDKLKNMLKKEYTEYEDSGEINIYTKQFTNKLIMIEYSYDETKLQLTFNKILNKIIIKNSIYTMEFNIKEYNEKKINIDYKINYGILISGNLLIENNKISEEKLETNINLAIEYLNYNLNLKGDYNLELNNEIFNINTEDALNSYEININEFNKTIENIMNKLENSNIYKLINGFSTNINSLI